MSTGQRRRRGRMRRLAALAGTLGVLGLVAGAVVLPLTMPPPQPHYVDVPTVEVASGETLLVCPGAPQLPGAEAAAEVTYDLDLDTGAQVMETRSVLVALSDLADGARVGSVGERGQLAEPVTTVKDIGATPLAALYPSLDSQPNQVGGISIGHMEQGDLRGMVGAPCLPPSASSWLIGGTTEVGSSTQLVLTNPGETPAQVRVQGWSAVGPIGGEIVELVEPGSTKVVLTETLERTDRLAYHVTSEGGQVGAYLLTSSLDGIIPQGVSYVAAGAPPALDSFVGPLRLEKYGAEREASLRIANPGEEPAELSITLLGPNGPEELGGTQDLTVESGVVTDIPLAASQPGDYTLHIDATHPVVASAQMTSPGEEDPDLGGRPVDLAWLPSGHPATDLLIHTPDQARAVVANPSADDVEVEVAFVDGQGQVLKSEQFVIPGLHTQELPTLEDAVGVRVTGGVLVGSSQVDRGQGELIAAIPASTTETDQLSVGIVVDN